MLSAAQRTLMTLILQKKSFEAIAHLDASPTMDVNFSVSIKQYKLYGFTPLMMAANFAQENVVSALLKRNANVTATDLTGKTALHYAVGASTLTSARSQIIERLTDASKDLLTITDNFGNKPIDIAALNVSLNKLPKSRELQKQSTQLQNELPKPSRVYTPSLAKCTNESNKENGQRKAASVTEKLNTSKKIPTYRT